MFLLRVKFHLVAASTVREGAPWCPCLLSGSTDSRPLYALETELIQAAGRAARVGVSELRSPPCRRHQHDHLRQGVRNDAPELLAAVERREQRPRRRPVAPEAREEELAQAGGPRDGGDEVACAAVVQRAPRARQPQLAEALALPGQHAQQHREDLWVECECALEGGDGRVLGDEVQRRNEGARLLRHREADLHGHRQLEAGGRVRRQRPLRVVQLHHLHWRPTRGTALLTAVHYCDLRVDGMRCGCPGSSTGRSPVWVAVAAAE